MKEHSKLQLAHNAIRIVLSMTEGQQRAMLRKYLLGELPELKRSQLADRYFVDEKLFDDLLEIENELLDQYVSGRLSVEEQKQFRNYLVSLPDGSTKLATAYALKEAGNEIGFPPLAPVNAWSIFRAALSNKYIVRYASAAIIIAVLCGLAYLIISQRALRREVEQLRVEQTQTQQQARTAQENEATLRDRNLQLERELAQLQEQKNQQDNTRDGPVLAVHVFSPALRSSSTPDSITIFDTTKSVLLVMPIPEDEDITTYNAMLRTTGGQLVWRNEQIKPQQSRQGRTASLRLPAARLTQSTYKLTLQGKTTDGLEIAHDFYFNIIRKE